MDLTAQIIEAITAWLTSLTAQLIAPALAAVGALLFATPSFDQLPEVESVWSLVRAVTNALFVLAVLAAGILVMASGTAETRYSAKLLVPRLALAAIGANVSLTFAGELIRLNNALITGFLGADPAGATVGEFTRVLQGSHPVNQYVTILIGLWAALLALLLVALYIGRDLALLLATVLAPLALATYALPQTDEIARYPVCSSSHSFISSSSCPLPRTTGRCGSRSASARSRWSPARGGSSCRRQVGGSGEGSSAP